MPAEPVIPATIPVPSPDASPEHIRLVRFTPTIPLINHTDEAGPSGHAHIPPISLSSASPFRASYYTTLSTSCYAHSDPYHPSHFPAVTTDDLLLSLQLQVDILFRKVHELQQRDDVRPPPPPVHPPPPPPRVFPPDLRARVLTLEQQIDFLICRVHELEEELTHLHGLVLLTPPPIPPLHHRHSLVGYLL
ncbi:hypothetical protein Hanom_Chr10g00891651 [Helianthus anomalus]